MAGSPIILKELPNPDGKTRGYRLEIDEFIADNAMTNLFLLALSTMQSNSVKEVDGKPDWTKYYALGGIHWEPLDKWDGFENNGTRFCHHSLPTFPTWHRPYMLLFEFAVYEEMVRQANAFKDYPSWQKTYLEAAARFRLPYWDPIMPRYDEDSSSNPDKTKVWGCPQLLMQHEVYVRTPKEPNAPKTKINNPLYSFTFPKKEEWKDATHVRRNDITWATGYVRDRTVRRPPGDDGIQDHDKLLEDTIRLQAGSLATAIWQMLHPDAVIREWSQQQNPNAPGIQANMERDWNDFANNKGYDPNLVGFRKDRKVYATVSLEAWHDNIHGMIGTGTGGAKGQMGHPRWAGFEPMFWMHHNNIDRLLSLYQSLYPEKYKKAFPANPGLKDQLAPFRKDADKCYTSADPLVSNYWTPGFSMPGDKPVENVEEAVRGYFLNTYYWATSNMVNVQGKEKTLSLEGWPKKLNIKASEALKGENAAKSERFARISSLSTTHGVPEFVSQDVPVEANAEPQVYKIPLENVVQAAALVDKALPGGALMKPEAEEQAVMMPTWNAHVTVRKFAFDGTFTIHLFVGKVAGTNPDKFLTRKNEAGFTTIFTAGGDLEGCANCQQQREDDIIYEDVIPLTTILFDYLDANPASQGLINEGQYRTTANLTPEAVVPFLEEQLSWRVVDLGSQPIAGREQEANLEIVVTCREFQPPEEGTLMGSYGPFTPYPVVTRNKPGGYGYVYA